MFLLRYAAAILTVLAGWLTDAENRGMLLAAMWVQSGVAGDFDELWGSNAQIMELPARETLYDYADVYAHP